MSHLSIRTLIEDTVKSIDDSVLFSYARASDFNSNIKKKDRCVVLDPIKQSLAFTDGIQNLTKTYKIGMVFYGIDDLQGAEVETAKILDWSDEFSDKFINKLNVFNFIDDGSSDNNNQSQEIELTSFSKDPIIKVTVSAYTGYILTFNLIAPDDFNYCSLYE